MRTTGPGASSTELLVLGAGLAGLSAAYHSDQTCIVAESSSRLGGTAATLIHRQFRLDRGVHVLYFRDPWSRAWITDALGLELVEAERRAAVWFDGRYVPYPLQANLHALRASTRIQFAASAMRSALLFKRNGDRSSLSARDKRSHGVALARAFSDPYNEKLLGAPPETLTGEWMNGYVPVGSPGRLVRSLIKSKDPRLGSNATFCYPAAGGISRLAEAIASRGLDIRFDSALKSLDYRNRIARFSDEIEIHYRRLVSTIPLVDLVCSLINPTFTTGC